ncbi:MAG: SUMF1/EgtB/PvdO family nonheme iron enzyme [Planctomycetes bacterium]|nr:SUMF1/EgtB/PvdO family nonheme iron enzyme [Planctomycetota bacterium]
MKTRLGSTLAGLFILIGVASHSAAADAKSKKTDLEGTWNAVKKDSAAQQLKFTGNKFEAKIGGKVYKGTFKLNNDKNPLWIDMKITESSEKKHKGKTVLGIYEFQGENLRWCASQPGRKRRPTQFAKQMGDARLLLGTFKKKSGKTKATTGNDSPLNVKAPAGMVWITGGKFTMGNKAGAPDKNPKHLAVIPKPLDAMYEHKVELDGFWMDAAEVTNRQFKRFVDASGYVTVPEKDIRREDLKGQVPDVNAIPQEKLKACSICFNKNFNPRNVNKRMPNWVYASGIWNLVKGADWRHPEGPKSSIKERMDHPVVHIAWPDAVAYCKWAGKELPTEAQWEYAARGGLKGKSYPWGNDPRPGGKWRHNIWQGEFPFKNLKEDGYKFTAPVKSFPPNGYGLYDMSGNVWEWCADWYRADYYFDSPLRNPPGPKTSLDDDEPKIPKRVQRGGSFMCSDNYCIGYCVAARMKGDVMTGSFHCGFRCVVNAKNRKAYRNAPARKFDKK